MVSPNGPLELKEKIRFLSKPETYGADVSRVEPRETHMSWVFLTDARVYKLKKPVRHSFLDFGSVEKRHFFCAEELRLNRRLAANTYRRIVPIRRNTDGRLSLEGSGQIVDWLVEMERLPQADMLDERLRGSGISPMSIVELAELLAGFYAGCKGEIADGTIYLRHLSEEQNTNRTVLVHPETGLKRIASAALNMVDALLAAREPDQDAYSGRCDR